MEFDEIAKPTILSVIKELASSENIDCYGVIPIENSVEGIVRETIDNLLLLKYTDMKIVAEISIPINHCLVGFTKSLKKLEKVISHPQAIAQCYDFLTQKLSENITISHENSTALAVKNLSKGRALVPKEFISEKNIEKIRGIYIPFWLFDLKISGTVNSNANKVRTWAIGNTRFIKTSYYKLFRTATMEYKDIPVDASTRFANDIMNSLEPFDYKDMVQYNHAYLSGFFAEKYDVDNDSSIKEASDRALESAKDLIINDMSGYDSVSMYENTLSSSELSHEYVLLPVWMVNVKYKDKMYLFAMNGQTGEFIGDIPVDKNKAILYGIITFVITVILVIVISFLIYK